MLRYRLPFNWITANFAHTVHAVATGRAAQHPLRSRRERVAHGSSIILRQGEHNTGEQQRSQYE